MVQNHIQNELRFEIKSHKFAVSLFIIEIHFSGGKLKLSHKKRVMKMKEDGDELVGGGWQKD